MRLGLLVVGLFALLCAEATWANTESTEPVYTPLLQNSKVFNVTLSVKTDGTADCPLECSGSAIVPPFLKRSGQDFNLDSAHRICREVVNVQLRRFPCRDGIKSGVCTGIAVSGDSLGPAMMDCVHLGDCTANLTSSKIQETCPGATVSIRVFQNKYPDIYTDCPEKHVRKCELAGKGVNQFLNCKCTRAEAAEVEKCDSRLGYYEMCTTENIVRDDQEVARSTCRCVRRPTLHLPEQCKKNEIRSCRNCPTASAPPLCACSCISKKNVDGAECAEKGFLWTCGRGENRECKCDKEECRLGFVKSCTTPANEDEKPVCTCRKEDALTDANSDEDTVETVSDFDDSVFDEEEEEANYRQDSGKKSSKKKNRKKKKGGRRNSRKGRKNKYKLPKITLPEITDDF